MKKLISIILVLVIILSTVTSTAFAHSTVDEHEHNEDMASINGAIGTCPNCGKPASYTCIGPVQGTSTPYTCTTHDNCKITNILLNTECHCYICGYTGIVNTHNHYQVHSSGVTYTVCIYS